MCLTCFPSFKGRDFSQWEKKVTLPISMIRSSPTKYISRILPGWIHCWSAVATKLYGKGGGGYFPVFISLAGIATATVSFLPFLLLLEKLLTHDTPKSQTQSLRQKSVSIRKKITVYVLTRDTGNKWCVHIFSTVGKKILKVRDQIKKSPFLSYLQSLYVVAFPNTREYLNIAQWHFRQKVGQFF